MTTKTRRIGIMGGTFNPIHIGHLILAEHAYEEFALDKVMLMPSGTSYLKKQDQIASREHRKQMTALAIRDNPHFQLSTLELERQGATYTFETIQWLNEKFENTNFYFILGEDALFQLESWKFPEKILEGCVILAACRQVGYGKNATLQHEKDIDGQIAYLTQKYRGKIYKMHTPNMEISSAAIRSHLREGKSVKYYVPEPVESYIYQNRLYQ